MIWNIFFVMEVPYKFIGHTVAPSLPRVSQQGSRSTDCRQSTHQYQYPALESIFPYSLRHDFFPHPLAVAVNAMQTAASSATCAEQDSGEEEKAAFCPNLLSQRAISPSCYNHWNALVESACSLLVWKQWVLGMKSAWRP